MACVPPVPSPQATTKTPYPASPLSAAASGQESRASLGCTRNASVNSTLNALHASVLFPPISAAHALADRSRYRLPSKPHIAKNTRPPTKSNIPHLNNGAGTIDDKTGNYRRAPGTIDDGKKTHETQEKTHPKLPQQGDCWTSTRNDYGDASVLAYLAPSSLRKTGFLAMKDGQGRSSYKTCSEKNALNAVGQERSARTGSHPQSIQRLVNADSDRDRETQCANAAHDSRATHRHFPTLGKRIGLPLAL